MITIGDLEKYKAEGKVCFFSGPRPQNLPSQNFNPYQTANKRMLLKLREVIVDHIENKGIEIFITGLAQGIDLWAARIVIKLKELPEYAHIKLFGAIPVNNQSRYWTESGKIEWEDVFNSLDGFIEVYKEENYKLNSRLEFVDEEFYLPDGTIELRPVEKRVQPTVKEKMQKRNEFMVDYSNRGIIVFTGLPGGTMNCALYAASVGLGDSVVLLNPGSLRVQEGIV